MNLRYLNRRFLKWLASLVVPLEWSSRLGLWEIKNKILRCAGIKIGKGGALVSGFQSVLGSEELLEVGEFSSMAHGGKVINLAPVRIGAYTTMAADVTLATGGPGVPFSDSSGKKGMNIGRGCWVGNGACLIGHITVGDHAIIGAGAVVTRDIPSGAIAVGIPARVIRYRTLPERVWFSPDFCLDIKTFELLPHGSAS